MFNAGDYSADRRINFDEYMMSMGRSQQGSYKYVTLTSRFVNPASLCRHSDFTAGFTSRLRHFSVTPMSQLD